MMVDDSVNKLFGRFLLTIGATEATARVIHNAPKGLLKCTIGQSDKLPWSLIMPKWPFIMPYGVFLNALKSNRYFPFSHAKWLKGLLQCPKGSIRMTPRPTGLTPQIIQYDLFAIGKTLI
ncbi:MAG TPA: hypothetical protein DEQ03_15190 [Marinilabiliales bacterium]|nr:hypothetical protein [Marinilabiliales bacterium]